MDVSALDIFLNLMSDDRNINVVVNPYNITSYIFTDDFRIVENEVYNQDWRSRGKLQIFQYQVLKWVLALFVGVVVGLVGFFSNIAVENIAGFKLLLTGDLMLENRYGSRLLQVTMPNSFYFLLHFA